MLDRFEKLQNRRASFSTLPQTRRAEKFKSLFGNACRSRQTRARYLRVEKTNLIRRRLPTEL
ncbi:MAG: hypothetical protein AVDCRST_MAG74-1311 [uncultured Pyrinomonadaceae bacterium]|uniref:Uncharacterized protein n=1 Tax=uncultured Pyrinomonadaceae bacterium TaxID=2283094 RepID=A0A6J4N1X2_9BACT|nr:MAG: hypothetical protein AVDCRST_MAG74-1311 [uncultured Pyrinomonadaceae bacterium]